MARPGAGRKQPGGVTKSFTSNLPSVEDVLKRTSELKVNENTTPLSTNAISNIEKSVSNTGDQINNDSVESTVDNTPSLVIDTTTSTNIEEPIQNTTEQINNDDIDVTVDNAQSLITDTTATTTTNIVNTYKEPNEKNEKETSSVSSSSVESDSAYQHDPFENLSQKELILNKEVVYLDVYSLEHADLETYYNHFRDYTDEEMAKLIYSIITNGIIYPLIVYKEKSGRLIVLSGNHRLIAVLMIIQLYSEAEWFDEDRYKTIKCIVLEEEDETGNRVSLDEARRIVLQTNIRREDTSEEEIAATLHYEKEILERETSHIYRFPVLQTLSERLGLKKTYVHYMLQIYENLMPDLKVLYYQKKAFRKEHAILLSKLSPEIQRWVYNKYVGIKRLNTKYLSQLDEKTITELITKKDIEGIKTYIDLVLGSRIQEKGKLVEIKHKIPQNAKEVARRTLDEIATAATNLTEGNTLMTMMCEVPEQLVSEDIRKKCLDAIQKIIDEAKGAS